MKLKELIPLIDWLSHVVIWTEDSAEDEEPAFDGLVMNLPWIYLDYYINRPGDDPEEPIYISQKEGTHEPIMVINLTETKPKKKKRND